MISVCSRIAVAVTFVARVSAHYVWPTINDATAWDVVRETDNKYDKNPLQNVMVDNFRCYNLNGGAASASNTLSLKAGESIRWDVDQGNNLYHIGVVNVYAAQVPEGETARTWDGAGEVWFKIFEISAEVDPTGASKPSFPATGLRNITFNVPNAMPSGEYLFRSEAIALHDSARLGGAQFYVGCAQVAVTEGGSGTPGPLVAIPGVYTGNEPGILFDAYVPTKTYTQPGPAVWSG